MLSRQTLQCKVGTVALSFHGLLYVHMQCASSGPRARTFSSVLLPSPFTTRT